MPLCNCFKATSIKQRRDSLDSSSQDGSTINTNISSPSNQDAISLLQPAFLELLIKFALLSHAGDFEQRGCTSISQASHMSEKELSFLKPLQRRKLQTAISEFLSRPERREETEATKPRKITVDVEMKDCDEQNLVNFFQPGVVTPNGTEQHDIFARVTNVECVECEKALDVATLSDERSFKTLSSASSVSDSFTSPSNSFVVEPESIQDEEDVVGRGRRVDQKEDTVCSIIQRIFELSSVNSISCVNELKAIVHGDDGAELAQWASLARATLAFCYRTGHGTEKDNLRADQLWAEVNTEELTALALGEEIDELEREKKNIIDFSCLDVKSSPSSEVCAQFLIGLMDDEGLGKDSTSSPRPRDRNSGAQWYLKAARMGHNFAQHALAMCLFYGDGAPEDKRVSVQWDKRSAAQGNAQAQYALGVCYDIGEGVEDPDERTAFNYYKLAADQEHPLAMFTLGQCYEYGSGTVEDQQQALKCYSAAATLGNADALDAKEAIETSVAQNSACTSAVSACRRIYDKPTQAVSQDDVHRLLNVDERGAVCDECLVPWHTLLSKTNREKEVPVGHPLTMATAAVCYYYGYGVEESYKNAKILWSLVNVEALGSLTANEEIQEITLAVGVAVKQYACFLLGGMLIIGQGRAEEDDEEGAILLTRASESSRVEGCYHPHGLPHAQFSLGACHFYGVGVDYLDRELGVEYYTKAAIQGHQDAIEELTRLREPVPALNPQIRNAAAMLTPLKLVDGEPSQCKHLADLDSLSTLLLKLLLRFDAMKGPEKKAHVIEQWHFVSEARIRGTLMDNADFETDVSNFSGAGLMAVNGLLYRLGTPNPSELLQLQQALQKVSHAYQMVPDNKTQQIGELAGLVTKAQDILAQHGTASPISILSIAAVESEMRLQFSAADITAVALTQALQRGRITRRGCLRAKQRALSAIVIQAATRRRLAVINQQREHLWRRFHGGVITGDFQDLIDAVSPCSKIVPENDPVLLRSRQLSTLLLADAQVRWLGFSVLAHGSSLSGFSSGFVDTDERSWHSLQWTPYLPDLCHRDWLELDFPLGFRLGDSPVTSSSKTLENEVDLDPHFADSHRYSEALYRQGLDLRESTSWRLHTGKGSFFFVLHLAGPLSPSQPKASGLVLSITNPDADSPLVDTVIDLNQTFTSDMDMMKPSRQSKVLVFQFQVGGRQPAIVVTLMPLTEPYNHQFRKSFSRHDNKEEENEGCVCGFEVVLDTSSDSLWWLNSEFYCQNASANVDNIDDHEMEMEKFRRATARAAWETAGSKRQLKDGTKESLLLIRSKGKKFEPTLKSKHISYNPTSRLVSCFEPNVLEPEWVRRVIGRASPDTDDCLTLKVFTCNADSETRENTQALSLSVLGDTNERDAWVNFINRMESSSSTLRYSCDDLVATCVDAADQPYRSQSMDTIERPGLRTASYGVSSRAKPRGGKSEGKRVGLKPLSPVKPNDRKAARRSPPVKRPAVPTGKKVHHSRLNSTATKRVSPVRKRP